jgi:thiamine phosphate synthase YjbQ (UPF0047 family)
MIEKKALLEQLIYAMKTEEGLITVYSKHLRTVMDYADLAPAVRNELMELVERLMKESEHHYAAMQGLCNSISNRDTDAY